jgi:transposase
MKSLINQAGVSRRRFLQVSGAGVVTATAIGSGLITPRAAFAEPYSGTFTWISPRGTIEVMDDYAIWVAQEMGYFGDLGVDVVGWSIMSKTTNKFSPEVRERAVRLVLDNQDQHESRWQAILSISSKIGCAPQTLNDWVKKVEVDTGQRGGITTEVAEKMKALERENRELKQANEILRKASAYFAQAELDRPFKR